MNSFRGDRVKPFYTLFKANLGKEDIRRPLIEQLEHELDGVIPLYGELKEKLIWAEIGVILPKDMVWICIPNNNSKYCKNIKKKYKKAISNAKDLKFSYNILTKALHNEDDENVRVSLEKIIRAHFVTVQKGDATHCREIVCHNCSGDSHQTIIDAACHEKCHAMTSILVSCTQKDFCDWFDFVQEKFSLDSKKIAHTFFVILKPGSYFHSDIKTLQKNIIGGALFHWDKIPPSDDEILFLRRNIMNTLWAELGSRLRLFDLSGFAAVEIPALIELAIKHDPFSITWNNNHDHNDMDLFYRQIICERMASKYKKQVCKKCPSKEKAIKEKTFNGATRHPINDFCGSLSEYKGMFQRDSTKIFITEANGKNNFNTIDYMLFRRMVSFLDLKIKIDKDVAEVKLPYCPAWLFLATIRLLSDTLKANKIVLSKIKEDKWCISINFPLDPSYAANITTSVNNLESAIESNGYKGDSSSAILDVLYGRLGVLQEYMAERYPNNSVVKKIIAGNSKPLMDCTITKGDDNDSLKVCFTWPKRNNE